jgi:hypothetical protein
MCEPIPHISGESWRIPGAVKTNAEKGYGWFERMRTEVCAHRPPKRSAERFVNPSHHLVLPPVQWRMDLDMITRWVDAGWRGVRVYCGSGPGLFDNCPGRDLAGS